MDGLEATRQIRDPHSTALNHEIPIVAMTAHAMQSDRDKCLNAGMNDYVSKPVSPQALVEALDRWLPRNAGEIRQPVPIVNEEGVPGISEDPDVAVFDPKGLLSRLMDDADLARTVAAGFLQDIPKQIGVLRSYLEAGEVPSAERQAHTIKGAAASVGGEAMRFVATDLEKAAKAGDLASVMARFPELDMQFQRLKVAMNAWLQGTN